MDVTKQVLKANKFSKFNPMQEKTLPHIGENLVVSAPTASGKTIIAELFILDQVMNKKKKVIYTCPLRALASEHYNDFKKKYIGLSFALSTGDIDSNSSYLKKFDVIFTTYEKLSSLLRHKSEWLQQVGCLIIDELHEIDSDRGPVLEIAITQLRNQNKELALLGLSATIPNSHELSEWLDAKLIESDFRPVKLKEGISLDKTIYYKDGEEEKELETLVEETLAQQKQALFFMNSRKRAEGNAKKLISKTKIVLTEKEKIDLEKLSEKVLNVLEQPTLQCSSLADCIKEGSAFHHAGLVNKQRTLVEDAFKERKIKIISATPTLAAGINAPADIVVIPTLYRYGRGGMELLGVREVKQMVGRSGRPKFSTEGKSILKANSEDQKDLYLEKYLLGEMEPILSKLSIVPILRTHVLGLIATNDIYDDKSIWKFFEKTLYSKQLNDICEIFEKVSKIVDDLEEKGFVEKRGEYFKCTEIGKRVSDLFLDPESAFTLITALQNKKEFDSFSYLYSWCNCHEFYPLFRLPKKLQAIMLEEFNSKIKKLPFKEEELFFESNAIETYFSAFLLNEWINETREQELFEKFGLSPGALFGKNRIIEWLAYATIELSKVLDEKRHILPSKKIALRTKYGIKEELLALVELKGIGRARARKLYNTGITKPSEIKKNISKVENLLGKAMENSLKKQLKIN